MPTYDFHCAYCGRGDTRKVILWEDHCPIQYCETCTGAMDRLPSAPNFTIKGFSAKNGYSK